MYQSGPKSHNWIGKKKYHWKFATVAFYFAIVGKALDWHLLSPNYCPPTSTGILRGKKTCQFCKHLLKQVFLLLNLLGLGDDESGLETSYTLLVGKRRKSVLYNVLQILFRSISN